MFYACPTVYDRNVTVADPKKVTVLNDGAADRLVADLVTADDRRRRLVKVRCSAPRHRQRVLGGRANVDTEASTVVVFDHCSSETQDT